MKSIIYDVEKRWIMEKRIINYRKYVDEILKSGDVQWDEVLKEHLVQISFFQHERLIHLIVTVLFALMEIISIVATVATVAVMAAREDLVAMAATASLQRELIFYCF